MAVNTLKCKHLAPLGLKGLGKWDAHNDVIESSHAEHDVISGGDSAAGALPAGARQ